MARTRGFFVGCEPAGEGHRALAIFAALFAGHVQATFWVDSVANAERELRDMGSEILLSPEGGPGGSFMIVKHPDALVVHRPESPESAMAIVDF